MTCEKAPVYLKTHPKQYNIMINYKAYIVKLKNKYVSKSNSSLKL